MTKGPNRWQLVLERMFEELRSGSARAESYWAQQLAFGPVFFHAVALAVRADSLDQEDRELLRQVLPLTLLLLGPLPDGCDGDPASLVILARRQARVLTSGRRRQLVKLAGRLGLEIPALPSEPVPSRLRRPHRLIGWRPSEPQEGSARPRTSSHSEHFS